MFLPKCNGRHIFFYRHCLSKTRWLGGVVVAAKDCPVNKDTTNICFTFLQLFTGTVALVNMSSLIPVFNKASQMVPYVLLHALSVHRGPGCQFVFFHPDLPEGSFHG